MAEAVPCGHKYDEGCIESWLTVAQMPKPPQFLNGLPTCPLCRGEITHLKVKGNTNPIQRPAEAVAAANGVLSDGQALILSVAAQNLDSVDDLIENGDISEYFLNLAAIRAAETDQIEILQRILANGAVISDKTRGFALEHAARLGNREMVQLLLLNGQIPIEQLGKSVELAAEIGRDDIVELLCNQGEIPKENLGFAVVLAAQIGRLDLVNFLLGQGSISPDRRGLAACRALEINRPDIAAAILRTGSIPKERWDQILNIAKQKRFREIVRILMMPSATSILIMAAVSQFFLFSAAQSMIQA